MNDWFNHTSLKKKINITKTSSTVMLELISNLYYLALKHLFSSFSELQTRCSEKLLHMTIDLVPFRTQQYYTSKQSWSFHKAKQVTLMPLNKGNTPTLLSKDKYQLWLWIIFHAPTSRRSSHSPISGVFPCDKHVNFLWRAYHASCSVSAYNVC